jgi:divalent metal cation (Fe/Co/Zn/Cd) transporter
MSSPDLITVHTAAPARVPRSATWHRAVRRARLLSWISLGWMTAEGVVGVVAGVLAGSVALVGFGLDSAIEGLASVIVIWRFTGSRTLSETSERRAQRAVGVSFFLLAPYIAIEAIVTLASGQHADTSWVGIGLAVGSIVLMPLLGRAKQRLGRQLDSAATAGEGMQNLLCAYLAGAVLIGLIANTTVGAWWLDPLAALFIAYVAVREGRESWRGDGCACHDPALAPELGTQDCGG